MYGEVTIACFIKKGTNTDMVWIWDKKQVSMGRRENYSTTPLFCIASVEVEEEFRTVPSRCMTRSFYAGRGNRKMGFRKLLTDRAELVSLKLFKSTFNEMRHCYYEKSTFKTMG